MQIRFLQCRGKRCYRTQSLSSDGHEAATSAKFSAHSSTNPHAENSDFYVGPEWRGEADFARRSAQDQTKNRHQQSKTEGVQLNRLLNPMSPAEGRGREGDDENVEEAAKCCVLSRVLLDFTQSHGRGLTAERRTQIRCEAHR